MRFHQPKLILAILLISLCSLSANADEAVTDSTNAPSMNTAPSTTNNPAVNPSPAPTSTPTVNTSPTTTDTPTVNPSPTTNDTPTVNTSPTTIDAPTVNTSPTTTVTPDVNTSPSTTAPTDANKQGESFATICLESWMKRFTDVKDKVGYKNFGQKYCACALTQPLDTDVAVDKAIQVCMTRILLQDSMNSLEDTVGLDKASDKEVNQACEDKWKLIYPQMSAQAQLNTTAFCSCTQPKLSELSKKSDNMTDKDYYTQIDSIAASCADMIKPNQQPKI
ncbi:MAG: hypothetical protein H0U73_04265 [Tatlockia sp.]|nr:hypothetical protein [Tatlockia sp.]